MTRILMLAAEHGGLPGGKIGGIGDVIEQLPPALVSAGVDCDVVLPSYGVYQKGKLAKHVADARVEFAGSQQLVGLYQLDDQSGAGCWVVDHPLFSSPPGQIYHHDPDDQPFATDANIYALFCASVVQLLLDKAFPVPDVIHLHDWHAATFAVLARANRLLAPTKLVYSIHNLALQGVRPLRGHPSSLLSWFPKLAIDLESLRDPTYSDCYNPTRAAIGLVDKVHVVSPTYAREVLESSEPELGLHGGEGLEFDLQIRSDEDDLVGILNGCAYSQELAPGESTTSIEELAEQRSVLQRSIRQTLSGWIGEHDSLRSSDYLARESLENIGKTLAGCFLLTSVGRITPQKVGLLLHRRDEARETLLDRLLDMLDDRGALVMLGTGDAALERQLVEHAARHTNFLFLRGYSDSIADTLYRAGDLFLMPSLFEPCGISQLLAMRAGQPCLVHATGGLKDTVRDGIDGFQFDGEDLDEKSRNCELALKRALKTHAAVKDFKDMRSNAEANRFTWEQTAKLYSERLYAPGVSRKVSGSLA